MFLRPAPQLENALIVGDPDSPEISLKLCDFGYSKDELVRFVLPTNMMRVLRSAVLCVC